MHRTVFAVGKGTPLSTPSTQSETTNPSLRGPTIGESTSSESAPRGALLRSDDAIASDVPSVHSVPGPALPLNAFQRLLRGWEEVHPYNAAQVMELNRAIDPTEASLAWERTLREFGLGRIDVGRLAYRHVELNGEMARYPVQLIQNVSLEQYVSDEMNKPFEEGVEPPFRPFILPNAAAGTCHLGVVYQHWIADSVAIRLLLRRWLLRIVSPTRLGPVKVQHTRIGLLGLVGLSQSEEGPTQTAISLVRRHLRYRRSRKVVTHGEADYPVAVVMTSSPELVPKLVSAAKRLDVRVNDLFLAAAARVSDKGIPAQQRKNRLDLAIGSIVDLRPLANGRLDDRFGLFLGFAEVVCKPAELASPLTLVRSVARQNLLTRRRGIWPSSVGWLLLALITRPWVPARKLYSFIRKETPIVAGVSNVNLNRTWVPKDGHELIVRYRRVSPTGPLAPAVFAVTSLGDELQLSLTYRKSLLTAEQAAELARAFLTELNGLTELI